MPNDAAPIWLRPIHHWFFWWEFVVPSIYRVVAVGVAAMATSALLVGAGLHPLIAGPSALVAWIGLAVAQEHDERVALPVDAEFQERLRELVDPLIEPRGFVFNHAFGPCRARSDRTETFLYERPDPSEHCADLWIHRDRRLGTMRVDFAGNRLSRSLAASGEARLATRAEQVVESEGDAEAIRAALAAAPEEFWCEPGTFMH